MARPRKNQESASLKPEPEETTTESVNTPPSTSLQLSEAEVLAILQMRHGNTAPIKATPPPSVANRNLKSIPMNEREDYILWHREAHIPETHALWCHENKVPFVRLKF